jgi:uncharacterized protein YdeI (YjbR/CyaY-like superfamily)
MTSITDHIPPGSPNGKQVVIPASRDDWRAWLSANGGREEGLWVVYRKRSADIAGPVYEDLVEEALCFGWIDSVTRRVDDLRVIQWFSPRRPGGIWSALNKERIARLQEQGLMTIAGQTAIDRSKADGSWSQTDQVDALIVPDDLQAALDAAPGAREAFDALKPSAKKQHLWAVHSAKRPETRSRRIIEVVRALSSD